MSSPRYSVLLTRDDSYEWPWKVIVDDSLHEREIGSARGKTASVAVQNLKARIAAAGRYDQYVAEAFESVIIEYHQGHTFMSSNGIITLLEEPNYAQDMTPDESLPEDDENDSRHASRLCSKCHISSAKYPNGDDSQIETHLNRYGIKQLLCFTCRLEEHLAKLKADKRLTSGMADSDAPWPFERWLAPGDMIRAHSLGVELVGHLPTITRQTIAECRNEMERSYF